MAADVMQRMTRKADETEENHRQGCPQNDDGGWITGMYGTAQVSTLVSGHTEQEQRQENSYSRRMGSGTRWPAQGRMRCGEVRS